jgi:hypothetical protein
MNAGADAEKDALAAAAFVGGDGRCASRDRWLERRQRF